MQYWFQRADFEAEEFESSSVATLVSAFQSHDWATELELRTELENADEEWCPPGFGLVAGDGRFLHLCPEVEGSVQCYYIYSMQKRILGIFPTERQVVETWLDRQPNAPRLIQMFFDDRHQDLIEHVRDSGG